MDISLQQIQQAQQRLAPWIQRTPLLYSHFLSQLFNSNIYLKLETLQATGAFKVRGAFNRLLTFTEAERRNGVVTVSAGNHGRAVAYAAQALGVRAVVLMPKTTSIDSINAAKACGAEVILTETLAEAIERVPQYLQRGYMPVHPFDDPYVMAGQGTIALECLQDLPELTDIIVSIGGGGLISGIATAIKAKKPQVRIFGVQVEGADAMLQAVNAGKVVTLAQITSIAKTLGAPLVSETALRIVQQHIAELVYVSNAQTFQALKTFLEKVKLLTEPAASCTLAAADIIRQKFTSENHVVLVLCGGNISLEELMQLQQRFTH